MKKFFITCSFLFLTMISFGQTTLPTSWNFSSPGIANPPAGWTLGLGTNGNLTYAFGIGDAISCRLDATGEFFSIQFTDKPGALSYYISPQNAGAAWGGQFDVQESENGSSWTTMRSITAKATTSTNYTGGRYTDLPASTSRYVRFIFVSKLPGGVAGVPGGNMGVDSVLIQAAPAPPTPAINVKRGTTSLVAGSTSVIGNAASTAFILENKGTVQALTIDSIKFTGIAASDYSVTGLPISINANSSNTVNVLFVAGANGSRFANMKIYCNDSIRSPFNLNLYGIGGSFATEPTTAVNGLIFSAVKSYSYKGSFTYLGSKPEKFIVIRKKGTASTDQPVDGATYKQGDYIGNSQVEKICDSIELLSPTYIHANTNYHYAIYSYNGTAGFENYQTTNFFQSNVFTPGKSFGAYYNGIDPKLPNFVTSLGAKIYPHDTIFYSNNIPQFINPWLTRDTSNGQKVVTCVYTNHQYIYNEPFQWANGSNGAVLTREHTWAQSWMPSNVGNPDWPNAAGTNKELPEYNDLFNLYPAHQVNANARRSNNPFDEVVTPTYTAPTGYGMLGKDSANRTAYEPKPEQKGDLARSLFYMAVCYNGVNGKNWSIPAQQNIALLRQWHQMDPVDDMEIAKNEYIAATQKNRNPFIDHPEWADRINFSNMSYIPMDTTIPKKPFVELIKPVSSDIWGKGKASVVSWSAADVDSIMVYFSDDSLTTTLLLGTYPANQDSINFIGGFVYTRPTGIVIIKDKNSMAADTSAYFKLDRLIGMKELISKQVLIFPNPVSETLFIDPTKLNSPGLVVIKDVLGQIVFETEISGKTEIDLRSFEHGVFLIQLNFGEITFFQKIFKN